jgi:hypothetical protein
MKKPPKTKSQRQPVEPKFPPVEEWQSILHDFALMPTQAETLKITLEEALDGIGHYQAKLQNQPSRSDLVKGLKNFEKALRRLRDECRHSVDLMHDFLPHNTLGYIGESLTFSAMGEALGWKVFPRQFDSMIEVKKSVGERITLELMEDLSRPMREALGLKHGHLILSHYIEQTHAPLARWIATKSLDRGGRPTDVVRNFLIYQLAEAAPGIIGKRATVATTGRFVYLCTQILVACGLPEAGIERAIPPVVRKLRANQRKWRWRPTS